MLVSPHVTLTYTNSVGEQVAMNFHNTIIPQRLLEDRPQLIHTIQQSNMDGSIEMSDQAGDCYFNLLGLIRHTGVPSEYYVRQLERVFNQTLSGVLHYRNANPRISIATKEIPCRVVGKPLVYWDWNDRCLKFDIRLVSHATWWQGLSHTEIIAKTTKLFSFRHSSPQRRVLRPERPAGFIFGSVAQVLQSTFHNVGNVRSGFTATLHARGGSVLNPEIINIATGERIRFLLAMAQNDVITIERTPQVRRVLFNGQDATQYLDAPNTHFFMLGVGENQIGFNAEENVTNLHVVIRYTPLFTFAEG